MRNRFATPDRSKWLGRLQIGPGPADRKRISHFVYDDDGGPISRIGQAYAEALAAVDAIRAHKADAEKAGRLTPLGLIEKAGEFAMIEALPKLRRARAAIEKLKDDLAEREAGLTLPAPDDKQSRAYEEVRAAMRGMTPTQRDAFIQENRRNPAVIDAVLNAMPALSGVGTVQHANLRRERITEMHGETLGEIADMREVIAVAERTAAIARDEIQEITGLNRQQFEAVASVAERNGGRLPFRVDRETDKDGKEIEIAKVWDSNAKAWRRATSDEITASATDSAAMAA